MFTQRQKEIIQLITKYYQENNIAPRASDIFIATSARRTFGSWNNALDAAGIPINCRNGHEQRFSKTLKECSVCHQDITNTRFQKYCQNCASESKNRNTMYMQRNKGLTRKKTAVLEKGGCCEFCGYNKNLAALVFHHNTDKKFGLDIRAFSNRSQSALNIELAKCTLLCHNCHTELHNPDLMGAVGIEPTTA